MTMSLQNVSTRGRPSDFRCVSNRLIYFCTQIKHSHLPLPLKNNSTKVHLQLPESRPSKHPPPLLTCTLKRNMHGLWCLQPKEALTLLLTLLAASAAPWWRKAVSRHKQTSSFVPCSLCFSSARGRTNLELREKFILPEGASQGLAAFRSRGRRSKPGSRNASPTRSSSSASHSGASLPSAPSAPATPTASASSRVSADFSVFLRHFRVEAGSN